MDEVLTRTAKEEFEEGEEAFKKAYRRHKVVKVAIDVLAGLSYGAVALGAAYLGARYTYKHLTKVNND